MTLCGRSPNTIRMDVVQLQESDDVMSLAKERSVRALALTIGVLLFVVFFLPNLIGRIDLAQRERAVADIAMITQAVSRYHHREGAYPTSIAELVIGGDLDSVVTDPWGKPYYFSTDQPDFAVPELDYYIWSLGEDNRAGGERADQDIGNWNARAAIDN